MVIGPNSARRSSAWPATDDVIRAEIFIGLLGLGLALLPGRMLADPTDEASKVQVDPEYAAGKAALAVKDWNAAVRSLSSAALRDTRNADIENYLGYAYRQSGDLTSAFVHYQRALQLDPRHRGAHEYIGEAYLIVNDLPKAEEHLAALERICLIPCEEYEDLKKAVAEYRGRAGK
jgi:tetratricopeptide (TPR) repeat protein